MAGVTSQVPFPATLAQSEGAKASAISIISFTIAVRIDGTSTSQ